jgi:hypothetical protein
MTRTPLRHDHLRAPVHVALLGAEFRYNKRGALYGSYMFTAFGGPRCSPTVQNRAMTELVDATVIGPLANRRRLPSWLLSYAKGGKLVGVSTLPMWTEKGKLEAEKKAFAAPIP